VSDSSQSILVTGGAGFIGSEVTRQLAARGARVTVVDNLINGKRDNLVGLPADAVTLVVTDVRNEERMKALLKGVDVIYHLACLGVRHSIHSPRENHEVNASATLVLLAAAQARRVGRFVYVSSSEVYGTARTVPMTEEHPTLPATVYGASKLAGEGYARAYHRTYGYPTVVVRPFNAYGPRSHHEGDCGEVIPKFMLRGMAGRELVIFGDGSQTRDFTYVGDVARGIIAAGEVEDAVGQTLNLGSGREIAIRQLAAEVTEVVGRSDAEVVFDPPRPGDVGRLWADTSRARELIGYRPGVELREGLMKLYDWYRSGGQSPEALLALETVRNWELSAGWP
jgi:UDP-glucose 4-epimerase